MSTQYAPHFCYFVLLSKTAPQCNERNWGQSKEIVESKGDGEWSQGNVRAASNHLNAPIWKQDELVSKSKAKDTDGCCKDAFFVSLSIRKNFLRIRCAERWDRLHWGQRKCWGQDFQDYQQDNSPMDEKLTTSHLWPFPTLCLNVRKKGKCGVTGERKAH